MSGDDLFGWQAQRIGRRDQIGLVIGEKFQNRRKHQRILKAFAKLLRRQPGQRQQPLRAILVLKRPAQRAECNDMRLWNGIL